jgi:cytochrome c biogenesis protein
MSQDTRTRPADPAPPQLRDGVDSLDDGAAVGATDVLERLWRFFISMRTGLWLILILGLMSLVGTLVPQAQPGVVADPEAYASFLESVRSKYGGWTTVMDKLSVFFIFTSIWFKAISVLLATSVLACSVNRAPRLWKVAFHPRTRMGATFFTHAPLRADVVVAAVPESAMDDVRTVLRSHHFRTVNDPDDEGLNLYADRFRWGPFGTVIAHVAFVIIVLGVFLSATTGFKESQLVATVGATVQVGHDTGLSVQAKSFNDAYYPDGSPSDYASDLILYKDGVQVDRKTVRVNHPLTWDGVSFYQSSFGSAAVMKVTDGAGKTVYGDNVPLVWGSKDGQFSIGQFPLPGKAMTVYVIEPASGKTDPSIKAGQVQLELVREGEEKPVETQVIDQGKPTTIAGLTYTFERTRPFTGLIVARDPGAMFVWVGSTLLVLGLILVFFFPHRRVWVRVRKTTGGSEILCASTMKRDVAFEPRFHQMVTDIQLAGSRSSTTAKVGQNDA